MFKYILVCLSVVSCTMHGMHNITKKSNFGDIKIGEGANGWGTVEFGSIKFPIKFNGINEHAYLITAIRLHIRSKLAQSGKTLYM